MKRIRPFLLIGYPIIHFIGFMTFILSDPSFGDGAAELTVFPFFFVTVLFVVHHIISYFHLKESGKVAAFQTVCVVFDLIFLVWPMLSDYVPYKECLYLSIIGLRFLSILSFFFSLEADADQ